MPEKVVIGNAELWLGDCREVLPMIGGVDAVVTDPPYGVGLAGKRTKRKASLVNTGYEESFQDTPEYVAEIVAGVVSSCVKRFGRVVVTPGTRNMYRYPEPSEIGCVFNPSGAGLGRWGFICFQPILYYGRDPYLAHGMGQRPNGFHDIAAGDKSEGHPCAKPVRWMNWLINKATLKGETVLDPFMGSGTTGVAAINLGRKFIGIEIEPKYFEIACKRIEHATEQAKQRLFDPEPEPQPETPCLGLDEEV